VKTKLQLLKTTKPLNDNTSHVKIDEKKIEQVETMKDEKWTMQSYAQKKLAKQKSSESPFQTNNHCNCHVNNNSR